MSLSPTFAFSLLNQAPPSFSLPPSPLPRPLFCEKNVLIGLRGKLSFNLFNPSKTCLAFFPVLQGLPYAATLAAVSGLACLGGIALPAVVLPPGPLPMNRSSFCQHQQSFLLLCRSPATIQHGNRFRLTFQDNCACYPTNKRCKPRVSRGETHNVPRRHRTPGRCPPPRSLTHEPLRISPTPADCCYCSGP